MSYNRTGSSVWGDLVDVKLSKNDNDGAGNYEMNKKSYSGLDTTSGKTALMMHTFGDMGGSDWRNQTWNEMPRHNHSTTWTCFGRDARQGWDTDTRLISSGGDVCSAAVRKTLEGGEAGNNWGMGIMPPYYVLTYIMKL